MITITAIYLLTITLLGCFIHPSIHPSTKLAKNRETNRTHYKLKDIDIKRPVKTGKLDTSIRVEKSQYNSIRSQLLTLSKKPVRK